MSWIPEFFGPWLFISMGDDNGYERQDSSNKICGNRGNKGHTWENLFVFVYCVCVYVYSVLDYMYIHTHTCTVFVCEYAHTHTHTHIYRVRQQNVYTL